MLALKPRTGTWAPADAAHTPSEAAGDLRWDGPEAPGDWTPVVRAASATATRRPGGRPTLRLGRLWPGPAAAAGGGHHRPGHAAAHSTWYLLTNLPRPAQPGRRAQQADLTEMVRLYGLRNWVEQGYKQVKQELGWADFMVRSDRAIRRHWALVCCAFCFCWRAFLADHPAQPEPPDPQAASTATQGAQPTGHRGRTGRAPVVAGGVTSGAGLVDPMDRVAALLAVVVASAPAAATPSAA